MTTTNEPIPTHLRSTKTPLQFVTWWLGGDMDRIAEVHSLISLLTDKQLLDWISDYDVDWTRDSTGEMMYHFSWED